MILALLASACTGGSSEDMAAPTDEPDVTETPTVEPTPEPTPEPTVPPTPVPLTEAEILDAAQAAFEAEPQPTTLIAYDLVEVRQRGTTGVTEVVVCGWTETTIFNEIFVASYRVRQDDDGAPIVAFESLNSISEECVNTEMVDTAFAATRVHDEYFSRVFEDPASYDAEVAATIVIPDRIGETTELFDELVTDGLNYRGLGYDAMLPQSSLTELLGRRFEAGGFEVFEVLVCRDLPPDYGLYRSDVLIDNSRDDRTGSDATVQYEMTWRDDQWFLVGLSGSLWIDCFGFDDGWFEAVNRLIPEPVPWIRLTP